MHLKFAALLAATAVAGAALAVPADAAKRKKVYVARGGYTYVQQRPAPTVIVTRGEDGRTRTKLLVQQRSYLDGGTEVMPGTYQPANSTSFYGQRATDILSKNDITNPAGPIPDPFFLPGKYNPYPSFR